MTDGVGETPVWFGTARFNLRGGALPPCRTNYPREIFGMAIAVVPAVVWKSMRHFFSFECISSTAEFGCLFEESLQSFIRGWSIDSLEDGAEEFLVPLRDVCRHPT